MIAVLCGGVGAARFLSGLSDATEPSGVTAIVNTGDDTVLHGLHICPDLDTIAYTLGQRVNPDTGWGVRGDTFRAMEALEALGGEAWFRLGDVDLGTHLYRTGRLAQGATLSRVTAEIAAALGVGVRILPMSDDAVRTNIVLRQGVDPRVDPSVDLGGGRAGDTPVAARGETVSFQDYFVRLHHSVEVSAVEFEGAAGASPAPGVLDVLGSVDRVVIAPSNPVVSIGPILAVPGIAELLSARRGTVVAISPIVAGRALKGPADRLLAELGEESSVVGVARHLREVCGTLVVDTAGSNRADEIEAAGLRAVVTDTVMATPERAKALAEVVLAC